MTNQNAFKEHWQLLTSNPTIPKNTILEKRNFSMGGEKWGARLFRPTNPIAWPR